MPHAVGLKNLLAMYFAWLASRNEGDADAAEFLDFLLREFFQVRDECLSRLVHIAPRLHPIALAHLASLANRASRVHRPLDYCELLHVAGVENARAARQSR